jgi:hypothetical protein
MRDSGERDQVRHYFFVVTRSRPDILARARESLAGNPRIEVIADRRVGERRVESAPCAVERRVSGRRRAGEPALDDRIHPTLFVPKHVPTYAELQQQVADLTRETANLTACLRALTAAVEDLR